MRLESFLQPLPLGILLELFLGKHLGVFAAVWLTVKAGRAQLPQGATRRQIYGVACLAGIGFTMSLFTGTLAFDGQAEAAGVRLGVLAGSLASALLGYGIMRSARRSEPASAERQTSGRVEEGA